MMTTGFVTLLILGILVLKFKFKARRKDFISESWVRSHKASSRVNFEGPKWNWGFMRKRF